MWYKSNAMEATNTREKIVELARDIIQRIGYHSFAYKQIADKLGIRNASIHHYFPNKSDLAVAIIEKDQQDFQAMIKPLVALSPTQRAEALLQVYVGLFKNGRKLCVTSTFGMVFNDMDKKVQVAVKAHVEKVNKWVKDTFEQGARSGEFSFNGRSIDEVVADWNAALAGSLAIGRMLGEAQFNRTISSLRKSLKD